MENFKPVRFFFPFNIVSQTHNMLFELFLLNNPSLLREKTICYLNLSTKRLRWKMKVFFMVKLMIFFSVQERIVLKKKNAQIIKLLKELGK